MPTIIIVQDVIPAKPQKRPVMSFMAESDISEAAIEKTPAKPAIAPGRYKSKNHLVLKMLIRPKVRERDRFIVANAANCLLQLPLSYAKPQRIDKSDMWIEIKTYQVEPQ
jgi:hypothetical protein